MTRDDFIAAYPYFKNPYGELCAISDVVGALCIKPHSAAPFYPVGTGFLIAGCGLFATATHVIEELDKHFEAHAEAQVAFYHTMPDGTGGFRPIAAAYFLENSDVAVGLCVPIVDPVTKKMRRNNQLIIGTDLPLVGEATRTISFPSGMASPSVNGGTTVLLPEKLDGKIMQTFPDGRGTVFPTPCIVIEGTLRGGSSGGPVLDKYGRVIAVNSMGGNDIDYWYAGFISDILNLRIIGLGFPAPNDMIRRHPSIRSMCGSEITFWPPLSGDPAPELKAFFGDAGSERKPIPLHVKGSREQSTIAFCSGALDAITEFKMKMSSATKGAERA